MPDRERRAEPGSSRLAPGDQITHERRARPRREEDRVRIRVLRRRYAWQRRLIIAALACWAIVATAGTVALFFQNQTSNRRARANYTALREEAASQCYRVAYLRWQDDRWRYASWRRDSQAAFFLRQSTTRAGRALASVFAASAASDLLLQQTDCVAATSDPQAYRPPSAVSFSRVNEAQLRAFLARAPVPPPPVGIDGRAVSPPR